MARPAAALVMALLAGLWFSQGGRPSRCGAPHCATAAFAADVPEATANYLALHRHYLKWSDGLFGSRRYHERKLRGFLLGLLGREIATDYDYVLASPEGVHDKTMTCSFQGSRWLHIHGELDAESFGKIPGADYQTLKGWWRSGILVALSGKVKNFRLDYDRYGDTVHLYLDRVKVLRGDSAR